MTEGACPGSCNARYREAVETWKQALALYDPLNSAQERPQPPDITPWPGDPVWCGSCTSRISQRLGQLDYAISILEAYADGYRDAPDGPLIAASAEAMSPSDAHDVAEDLGEMLVGWEDAYRKSRGWPASFHSEDLADWTTECSSWLQGHLRGILASDSPIAEDFGREILSWHAEIVSKAKAGRRKLRKPMRCPGCQQLLLTWTEGEDRVQCSGCHLVMPYGEYMDEVEHRAGGAAA